MAESDRGILAHSITPSMLRQSEENEGSFHDPADRRPVLYSLSNWANGPAGWDSGSFSIGKLLIGIVAFYI